MSKATHTPGPWNTSKRAGGIAIEHREERSYGWMQHEVALVYPISMPDKATGAANARLISAAPDLFAVLTDAYQYMMDYKTCQNQGLLDDMKAAIAKAKGVMA